MDQLDAHLVAHVQPVLAAHDPPFHGWVEDAHLPLDLRRIVLLQRAVAGQLRQLLRRIGTGSTLDCGLGQALRGETEFVFARA